MKTRAECVWAFPSHLGGNLKLKLKLKLDIVLFILLNCMPFAWLNCMPFINLSCHLSVGEWKEVRGLNGWDGLWLDDDHDVVQIGSKQQQHMSFSLILHCSLLHSHITVTPRLADDVSLFMFSLYLHTAYM